MKAEVHGQDRRMADLSKFPDAVRNDWTRDELFGLCMVEYPRWLHSLGPDERRLMLSRRPALTSTGWDAAIAASIEHTALVHGAEPPDWIEEPERFLEEPFEPLPLASETACCHLPAPFTRRGVVTDPRSLDRRTGDEQWSPELGDPEERWPREPAFDDADLDQYLTRLNAALYEQKTATSFKSGGPSLHNGCASIEQMAAREGWVVRVALSRSGQPATFLLRGPATAYGRIRALERDASRRLVRRALGAVGLSEDEWHRLLRVACHVGDERRVPAPTVWNRPTLTIAGTARGIRERWQEGVVQATELS